MQKKTSRLQSWFGVQDMTVGRTMDSLVRFSIPLLVGNLAQQLYNTVDSIVVGQYIGDTALAAVGTAGPILNLLLVLFMGIATGASILSAQYFGAHDRQHLSRVVGASILLTVSSSILMGFVGFFASPWLMSLVNPPADVLDGAVIYLQIIFIGILGSATYNILAGVLRGQDTPLLGVNAGHLGYLTQVSQADQIPGALDRLLAHDYTRDVRAMLHGSVRRNGEVIRCGTALNEILISRCEGISVLRFTVLCDGEELSHYTADGILFATPTGSTAYNLSAGGPIAAPETRVIIMTPICAHSTNSRPVILPDTSHIEVRIESENEIVAFDGERIVRLQPGDVVKVRRANEMTTFVKLRASSFLETLREKMDDED